MALRDLIVRNKDNNSLNSIASGSLFDAFNKDIESLFDGFFGDFGRKTGTFSPKVDVSDDGSELSVTAELPGMEEKDIDVSLKNNVLTIKGEKKSEHEEKSKETFRIERSYGSFQRSLRVPDDVDVDNIKATFKNGVLNISIPKSEKAISSVKQIEVKSA